MICCIFASTLFAGLGSWEQQQMWADGQTQGYAANRPQVRSDRFIFKTISLPDGSTLELDLRLERPKSGGPFPVMFFVHGGAWATGSKAHFCHQSFSLAENGIAGVRLEYRWKSHGGVFTNVMEDVLDSIDFIRQCADDLNIDFSRVGLAGGSAGGHLSAIAAQLTPECICYDGFEGLYDAIDRGNSRFGGGDFTGTTNEEKERASALYVLRENPPDTFLYHGTADRTIDVTQSYRFAEAIRKKGACADVLVYEGAEHSFFGKEPYLSKTTQALLDHVRYVFGLRECRPDPDDYISVQ